MYNLLYTAIGFITLLGESLVLLDFDLSYFENHVITNRYHECGHQIYIQFLKPITITDNNTIIEILIFNNSALETISIQSLNSPTEWYARRCLPKLISEHPVWRTIPSTDWALQTSGAPE